MNVYTENYKFFPWDILIESCSTVWSNSPLQFKKFNNSGNNVLSLVKIDTCLKWQKVLRREEEKGKNGQRRALDTKSWTANSYKNIVFAKNCYVNYYFYYQIKRHLVAIFFFPLLLFFHFSIFGFNKNTCHYKHVCQFHPSTFIISGIIELSSVNTLLSHPVFK